MFKRLSNFDLGQFSGNHWQRKRKAQCFKGMKEFEVGDDDFAGLDCTLHVYATKSFPKYASTPAEPCIIVVAPHNFRLTLG